MKIAFPFSRPSPSYLQDGSQVASDLPRYETGQFSKGITAEEGTTNLLTANQSSVETDTTGFVAETGATLSRDLTKYWNGVASLKVVTPGVASGEGFSTVYATATAGQPYSGSMYMTGSGQVTVYLQSYNSGAWVGNSTPVTVTLDGSWQRVKIENYVLAVGSNQIRFFVEGAIIAAITFYVGGLQIEQKAYATLWQIGGTTRAAETTTIPTPGVLNASEGTIQFKVIVSDGLLNKAAALKYPTLFRTDNTDGLAIYLDPSKKLSCVRGNGTPIVSASALTAKSYAIDVTWSSTTLKLFLEGVPVGTITMAGNISIASLAAIGFDNWNAGRECNAVIDDLRISSKARTDAEILADYNANEPLPVDEYTTCKANFNDSLYATKNRLIKPILRPAVKPWIMR